MYLGELDKAEEEARRLMELKEGDNLYGYGRLTRVLLMRGQFKDSIELANEAIEICKNIEDRYLLRSWSRYQAFMYSRLGHYERALELLDKVWEGAVKDNHGSMQRSVLTTKGLMYLEMNMLDKAQEMANQHKALAEKAADKDVIMNYYHLQGRIELEKGNYADAIAHIKRAISMLSANSSLKLYFGHSLALAYYRSGDLEQARAEFEKIFSLPVGRTSYGSLYVWSFYLAGKVCEELGDKAKAIEYYEKYVDLWKDADPEFTDVDDAMKRLAALKGQ
jgi:tetratricopeptide (TPR) repeat protein